MKRLKTLEEFKQFAIIYTLKHFRGNRTLSAESLGISITSLREHIRNYKSRGIDVPPNSESDFRTLNDYYSKEKQA